jgi:hypothetical protein
MHRSSGTEGPGRDFAGFCPDLAGQPASGQM